MEKTPLELVKEVRDFFAAQTPTDMIAFGIDRRWIAGSFWRRPSPESPKGCGCFIGVLAVKRWGYDFWDNDRKKNAAGDDPLYWGAIELVAQHADEQAKEEYANEKSYKDAVMIRWNDRVGYNGVMRVLNETVGERT